MMNKSRMFIWVIVLIVFAAAGCQSGPKLSPEELLVKWRAPLVISAFNVGICEGATDTAQKVQDGQIEGFEAFGELLGVGMMVQVVEESLAGAEPAEDQTELMDQMQSDMNALKDVLGPWINDEATSADVLAAIGAVCQDTNDTFEQVAKAASDDGMTKEAMDEIFDEVANTMDTAVEGAE